MSVTSSTEVELKYAVHEGATMPSLQDAPGVAGVEAQPDAHLEAVYLDTADRVLLSAGIAVRRRTGGHDAGWHVKLSGADGRVELHAPIDPADPDRLPADLERALRSRVRGRPLMPLARIRTERRGRVVTGVDGGRVEVVDDAVRATDVAAGVLRAWREWEAERLGDSPADAAALAAVDAALLASGATRSASPAKIAQALGGAALPQRPAPRDAGERLADLVAPLTERLHRGLLDLVVHGDESGSAVHGLRKTIRRLRSLLALRRVAGPAGADLRDRLGALATVLGEARDPLVGADAAEALLDGLPTGTPGLAEARAALVTEPRAAVPSRTAAAVEALLDADALETYDRLERFTADGPGAEQRERTLERLAERAVRRARHRAARASSGDLDALHAARRAAKRARMVVEELSGAGLVRSKRLRRSAKRERRVQEALGEHRDLALVLQGLPALSRRITGAGGNAYALGLVAAHGERRLARLNRTARRHLRRLR